MIAHTRHYFNSKRGTATLLASILAGPLLLLAQQEINFVLVRWVCAAGNGKIALHLVSLLCLVGTLGAGWLAWQAWSELKTETFGPDEVTLPRARFMATVGLMSSALFTLAILAQAFPVFVLDPCKQ